VLAWLALSAGALLNAAPAGANDRVIQPLTEQATLSAEGGWVAVSLRERGRYRLGLARAGEAAVAVPWIRSRAVPFDVDLGIDDQRRVVATYSRCSREHVDPDPDFAIVPYDLSRGCRPFQYSLSSRRESRLPTISGQSVYLPSRWRSHIVFATHRDRGTFAARRPQRLAAMNLRSRHVRFLRGGRHRLKGSQGLASAAPRTLDLRGQMLAFTWQADGEACPNDNGLSQNAIFTELWRESIRGNAQHLASACTRTDAAYSIRGAAMTSRGIMYTQSALQESGTVLTDVRLMRHGGQSAVLTSTGHFPNSLGVSDSRIFIAATDTPPSMYELETVHP